MRLTLCGVTGVCPWIWSLLPPRYRFYKVDGGSVVCGTHETIIRFYLRLEYERQLRVELVDWSEWLEEGYEEVA